ncbi:MAG TPA: YHS domain-containing protein [Thermoanaerobaculia bacterium]|nr:YHS domain-containing protein [Thermoanaerobaculia bacterium]
MLRRLLTSALCLLLAAFLACHRAPRRTTAKAQPQHSELRTIDNIDPRPVVNDPPPVLRDEAAPPRPKGMPWEPKQAVPLTPEDEKFRASLPFAPAIGLDPVDGSKISITAHTPILDYKGRLYYFSSEQNKRTFVASPEQYIKGPFSHL